MSDQLKDSFKKSKVFNPDVIRKGMIVFIAVTLVAFTAIFIYNDGAKSLSLWKQVDVRYLLLGLVFIAVDLYVGGLRNHIFVNEFVPGISQWVSIRANLANIFMGAVTPSQSGGGPAQWYIFYRNGLTIPDVIGTSFYNWISTLLFFPLSGALALHVLKDSVPEGFVLHLTRFGFATFSTLFAVVMVGLFAPRLLNVFIAFIAGMTRVFKSSWSKIINEKGQQGLDKLAEYRTKYLGLMIRKPQLMLQSFLLTVILYFNKYALAYIFILGFGLKVSFWPVIGVMAVIYLLLYFAPSPGGSGIAEVSLTLLLTPLIGSEAAATITLLHRSFLVFIPALLGSTVILDQLSRDGKEQIKETA